MHTFVLESLAIAVLAFASCAPQSTELASTARVLIACEEPRPAVCTHSYEPVCAVPDGRQQPWQHKTYDNDCTACIDDAVRAYRVGSCEEIARGQG